MARTGKTKRGGKQRPIRKASLWQRLEFEELESRVLPAGPSVLSVTPLTVINQTSAPETFDHIDVQFNEAINPATFTAGQVNIQGPAGPITPTGVTELASDTYEVMFDPLTLRGIYSAMIGPGIADPAGNVMSQTYTTSLEYVNASMVFMSNTTISEGNTSYDGQDICIDGATVAINGLHNFDSVQLINGAVLTHSADTASQTHFLGLNVTNQVIVDGTSKINVSGLGYLAGRTTGNTTVGGATGFSGGSYGGLGGNHSGSSNAVYGDYANPDDWGSGGTAAPGGGLVELTAGSLVLNGQLLANGTAVGGYGGGGSGGGIYIAVTNLSGQGLIQASGGAGNGNGTGGGGAGGGGGGRIAVYAADYSGFNLNSITAFGGEENAGGGAGTVYLMQPGAPQGTLIVNGGSGGSAARVRPRWACLGKRAKPFRMPWSSAAATHMW